MKLSIIIPVFNEEKTIDSILEKVAEVKLPTKMEKEIILVDDGSTDKTPKILSKLKNENGKLKIISHVRNLGKGAAIRTGLESATGEILVIQDADLEYDPQFYPVLLKPILEKKTKVVYGSRLIDYPLKLWGQNKTVLPSHLIANKILTSFFNFLYGSNLTDMETGYKLFSREVLNNISLKSDRFDIEPEITIKILKAGFPILEIPIKTNPRDYSQGKKIGFMDGLEAIWTIIKHRL